MPIVPKCGTAIVIKRLFLNMVMDSRGTSAVEYGIICAMIIIGLVSAVAGVAEETSAMWNEVSSKSEEAITRSR
ncbi:MAG: Flp family type IVb pilin [Novosphingobium sp.]|nr:Flp family type IVb pilin [Novosphingobium sp.]